MVAWDKDGAVGNKSRDSDDFSFGCAQFETSKWRCLERGWKFSTGN